MAREDKERVKIPKGAPDLSNVSLVAGIYISAVGCLVSYLILFCLFLHSPIFCHYYLGPLFLTSGCNCYQLWELGIESTLAFILLAFWDCTLLAVGELPFPFCVVL